MKIHSKNLVAQNDVFNLFFCNVSDSNGINVPNYLVVEPNTIDEQLIGGVAILPIVDKKIALIKIERPALRGHFWEIPHGSIEANESEEAACIRELREETGIVVDKNALTFLARVAPDSGILGGIVAIYHVKASYPSVMVEPEFGLQKVQFFDKNEVLNLISNNKLVDSFSLIGLFKAFLLKII